MYIFGEVRKVSHVKSRVRRRFRNGSGMVREWFMNGSWMVREWFQIQIGLRRALSSSGDLLGRLTRSQHSRFPGRFTRDSQVVSLEIPVPDPPFVKNRFVYCKIDFFYRKNHRKTNPEIFVYITPEKTRKINFPKKYRRKIHLTSVPAVLEAN